MKRFYLFISVLLFVFIGCANTQETKSNGTAPNGVKVRTASYPTECENCIAKFKLKVDSQGFTKEILYKTCPSCKKD